MSGLTLPRLRDDAVVRPFDDRGLLPRFVIAIDGCHFVVTPTVAAVLEESRDLRVGERNLEVLAARVARRLGKVVPSRQIEVLLSERIPKSFFEGAESAPPQTSPVVCRRLLVGGERLRPVLAIAGRLFSARIAVIACVLLLAAEGCLALHAFHHETAPLSAADFVAIFALTLTGVFFHELGHLAACHRFGGRHGGIGIGLYWCLPAFYAEVHGAWLLPRAQRAAVDAGGVYLQGLFVGLLAAAYLIEPAPALLAAIAWSHLLMLHTLNPVLKFDGYWLLCDLAGLHNLHRGLRQIARRLLSGRWPSRSELALLAAFTLIAAAYFAYLFTILGHNLGIAAAAFRRAFVAADGTLPAMLLVLTQGALLCLTVAVAAGFALLIARAARDVATERKPR